MEALAIIIFISIFMGGVFLYIYLESRIKKNRNEKASRAADLRYSRYAAQRNWQYRQFAPEILEYFQAVPIGRPNALSEGIVWVFNGTRLEHDWMAFQFFSVDSRVDTWGNRPMSNYMVVSINLHRHIPSLTVQKKGAGAKILNLIKKDQTSNYDCPEFDKEFVVSATDEMFARDVLVKPLKEYILHNTPQTPAVGFIFHGESLTCWTENFLSITQVDMLVDYLIGILSLVPREVWRDY